ncbi:MAG: hypothetical protein PHE60_11390 [Sulfurospirillaceae bacterium]|nr:hypothetical protein [Sulfurospirillaceae bacterium]
MYDLFHVFMVKRAKNLFLILFLVSIFPTLVLSKGSSLQHQNPFVSALPDGKAINVYGDFIATGNSVVCQNNGHNQCNNNYNGYLYDSNVMYKKDSATIALNSATATLTLPAGVTSSGILWAGLYWQGHIAGENANDRATDTKIQNRNKIDAILPDGTATAITADKIWFHDFWGNGTGNNGGYRSFYQGHKDVTTMLKSHLVAGNTQQITVGNIKANSGSDWHSYFYLGPGAEYDGLKIGFWGNWSLVVVYEYPSNNIPALTPFKSVQVAQGFDAMFPLPINGYMTFNVVLPITGFLTPTNGAISSKMLFYASGGEKKIERDAFYIQNANNAYAYTKVSNALNSADNPFNGTISNKGVAINPAISYYPGMDLDIYDVSQYMKNQQTNTALKLEAKFESNNGDQSTPGILAFSTDIYQPFITINKTTNINGQLVPKQAITYTANIKNSGNENAINIAIYDNFRENNISRTDGTLTNPLVTLEDLLDKNVTEMNNSIICTYGPTNTNCKNSCTVTSSPFKVACSIPRLDINATAFVQFQARMAANPDSKGQNIKVENKMYATYSNALTGIVITEPAQSNAASAGLYSPLVNDLFNAWESTLTRVNPRLYTKDIGENISFTIGKIDGSNYTGSICAQLVGGSFTSAYQCLTYSDVATQTFVWNGIATADQSVYVNIKNILVPNQTDPSIGTWSNSNSTDTFSIRPDHFVFNTAGLPANLRAGEDYTFAQVTAVPQTGATPVLGYNQNKANLTLLADKRRPNTTIDNTLHGALAFTATNFNFTDGTTNAMGFTYSDVGLVTIKLSDTNWCSTDAGDGTPIDDRTISGETNATFIPFDFDVANVTIQNDSGTGFTYLSNDLNMSAEVGMTITARNKQGVTTQNYADTLFEKTISITPTIKHGLIDANRTAPLNQDLNFINGVATIIGADNASAKFNFDRNASRPVNPFDVNGSDMNLTVLDTDNVQGDAIQTATGSARFYYGRAHAPDYRFPNADGNATIYYEVYCKDCNRTKYVNNWNESVNAINWYRNPLHVTSSGVVAPTPQNLGNFSNTAVTNTNPISTQRLTLRNTTATPYVDRIDLNSSSWLIAYPTNFTVEFYNSGRWAGAGFVKQEHANAVDNNTTVGGFVHQTAPTKANRRMTW